MLRILVQQHVFNHFLSAAINHTDQITAPFFLNLDLIKLTLPQLQYLSRLLGGTTGNRKHRIHRHNTKPH